MGTPANGTASSRWTAGRIVRVILGWVLVVFGGGLAVVMIVGLVLHPEALGRRFDSLDSPVPTWPFQIGWIVLNLATVVIGLRLALVAPRVRAVPPRRVDAVLDPAGVTQPERIRSRERQLAPKPVWTWGTVLRVAIAVLLLPAGAFLVIAALGLIATSGWDYLWSTSPAAGFGSSNLEAIITLGTVGAMLIMGGWSLIVDRHTRRTRRTTEPTDAAPNVTDRVG